MKIYCVAVGLLFIILNIVECRSERIIIYTNSSNNQKIYNFFPLRTNYLEFSVRATKEVHIVVTNRYDLKPPYYEAKLGGWDNKKSALRKDDRDRYVVYSEQKILNPAVFQTFWLLLNHTEGSISVGKNSTAFLYFRDPDYVKMTYFGITTAFGGNGEWNFDFDVLNCVTCD